MTPYSWPKVLAETSTAPLGVTSGVSYSQTSYRTVKGAAHVSVLNVDLSNPNVMLVPRLTSGVLASKGATLSSTIARTGAVAGVNGDYFDRVGYIDEPAGDGQPTHMLVADGQIVASGVPDDCGVVAETVQGTLAIGRESFRGVVTDGSVSERLAALNEVVWPDRSSQCDQRLSAPGLVLETPAWGARSALDEPAPVAVLRSLGGGDYRVLSVVDRATESPRLVAGEAALIGYGSAATFLVRTVRVGQDLSVRDSITPDGSDLREAFGGGYLAVVGGKVNPEIRGDNRDPEAATAIGVTASGVDAVVGVFDGGEPGEEGVGYSEIAGWLLEHDAYEGVIMDTGGSSEMDVRLLGDRGASVVSTPSDGHERRLAECVCFYSTEASPGPATSVTLNGGNPLSGLAGTTLDVTEVAMDAAGNPASGSAAVTVSPPGAATVVGTRTLAHGRRCAVLRLGALPGPATAVITDGSATSSIGIDVVTVLSSISLGPQGAEVVGGGSLQLDVEATAGDGSVVSVPNRAVTWAADDLSLGSVDGSGLFRAADTGAGVETIVASAGGVEADIAVDVGYRSRLVDPMVDVTRWRPVALGTGATASRRRARTAFPGAGETGVTALGYDLPADPTIEQAGLVAERGVAVGASKGEAPLAISLWAKDRGGAGAGRSALGYGTLTLALIGRDGAGHDITLYPATLDHHGWRHVVAPLPPGTVFPFTLEEIDVLVVRPPHELKGQVFLADLTALYPPPGSRTAQG